MGQQPPVPTTAEDIQDGIYNLTPLVSNRATAGLGRWDQGLQDGPFEGKSDRCCNAVVPWVVSFLRVDNHSLERLVVCCCKMETLLRRPLILPFNQHQWTGIHEKVGERPSTLDFELITRSI
jgi:hypothetical protein